MLGVDDLGELDEPVEGEAASVTDTPAWSSGVGPTRRLTPSSTIRALTVEELPLAAQRGHEFYVEAKLPGTFSVVLFVTLWTELLRNESGVMLGLWVDEECAGALAAMVAPDIYDGRLIATEFFWFVRAEYRGGTASIRLIRAYEEWALAKGVASTDIRMSVLQGVNDEQIEHLYRKLGYRPLERQWGKEA